MTDHSRTIINEAIYRAQFEHLRKQLSKLLERQTPIEENTIEIIATYLQELSYDKLKNFVATNFQHFLKMGPSFRSRTIKDQTAFVLEARKLYDTVRTSIDEPAFIWFRVRNSDDSEVVDVDPDDPDSVEAARKRIFDI